MNTTLFTRYHELRRQMSAMIRVGQKDYQLFNDAWTELEEIKNQCGGLPPVPEDAEAMEQEMAEMENESGNR